MAIMFFEAEDLEDGHASAEIDEGAGATRTVLFQYDELPFIIDSFKLISVSLAPTDFEDFTEQMAQIGAEPVGMN